jgi:hypothetical protein
MTWPPIKLSFCPKWHARLKTKVGVAWDPIMAGSVVCQISIIGFFSSTSSSSSSSSSSSLNHT